MKRFVGRGIGVIAGIPAGPAGMLFGFLIGALVDQYGSTTTSVRRLRLYLSRPEGERNDDRAVFFATAILVGTVVPVPTGQAISVPAGLPWPNDDPERIIGSRLASKRQRYVSGALSLVTGSTAESILPILEDLKRRIGDTGEKEADRLVELLILAAGSFHNGMTPAQREIIRRVGLFLGLEESRLEQLEYRYRELDSEACRIMGVSPTIDRDELKRVYRRLVANLHPDTSAVLDEYQRQELEEAFLRIRNAYDQLLFQLEKRNRSGV